jgi:hypothetical protein
LVSISPGLFAAAHVLHRLLAPRHPPCALVLLIRKNTCVAAMEFSRCTRDAPAQPRTPREPADAGGPVSQNSTACGKQYDELDILLGEPRHRTTLERGINGLGAYRSKSSGIPRKEVIQPQLPLRLPCYDFTPIINPTFDGCLPKRVSPPASGIANFRGVTGGVYKARERIHRDVADSRLLATPTSWRRVSASNPNRDRLFGIRSASRHRSPLYRPM